MRLIAITHPKKLKNEGEIINSLFCEGLPCLHLRKPGMNANTVESLLNDIDSQFHKHIVINDHIQIAERYKIKGVHLSGLTRHLISTPFNGLTKSCSCHSYDEIDEIAAFCDYVFLSPVFNSISKPGYHSAFDLDELKAKLSKPHSTNIIALGGINPNNIKEIHRTGFDGAAVLGGLWNAKATRNEVVSNFKTYKKQLKQCGLL